ncbi:unnamed protein product [Mytilus coruscus]|uniref:Uncharacterized protein n=1 Tax=Mytilus coruscus TaxID=42192 RepID=A0A6J8EUS3_MYTCO|nr:unnamed protein product [Mytilus coruscus]
MNNHHYISHIQRGLLVEAMLTCMKVRLLLYLVRHSNEGLSTHNEQVSLHQSYSQRIIGRSNVDLYEDLDKVVDDDKKSTNETNINENQSNQPGKAKFAHRWTNIKSSPSSVLPYKGSLHITVNPQFGEYATTNKTAIQRLKWLVGTLIPDESVFSTLNFNSNLGITGSFQGELTKAMVLYKSMTRYKIWKTDKSCNGQYVHDICIPAVEDLPKIHSRPELFINKVYWDYEHYVLDCLEESFRKRTIDNILGMIDLNISYYSNLYFESPQYITNHSMSFISNI